jgi:transposase InsO family protein
LKKMRIMFATHRIPDLILSDNGSCFTSSEFQAFLSNNGIQHCTTAPYHLALNGLAERAEQTLKNSLRGQEGNINLLLSRFLFHYRATPQRPQGCPQLSY